MNNTQSAKQGKGDNGVQTRIRFSSSRSGEKTQDEYVCSRWSVRQMQDEDAEWGIRQQDESDAPAAYPSASQTQLKFFSTPDECQIANLVKRAYYQSQGDTFLIQPE